MYGVHGAVNALPSRGGQIDAAQLAVRLNGAHSDALGKAFIENEHSGCRTRISGKLSAISVLPSVKTLRVSFSLLRCVRNRQHAAVPLHDHAEQCGGGAAACDVVRADIGDAVRVGDVRVEGHDRDALLLAERVDLVAHERVRERHKREAVCSVVTSSSISVS